jgi:hypothetical protein
VWVRSDATRALRSGKLIPVTIEPCNRPIQFELLRTISLSDWQGNAEDPKCGALVAAIRRRLGEHPSARGETEANPANSVERRQWRGRRRVPLLLTAGAAAALAIGAVLV